jgi:hypothetical protein
MPLTTRAAGRPAVRWRSQLFGLIMIAAGIAGWCYNHHLAASEGKFYIRLCVFAPLGVFGGLLMLLRPEWAGPLKKNSPIAQKAAVGVVIGLMAIASGVDLYWLNSAPAAARYRQPSRATWSPAVGTPAPSAGTPVR